MTNVNLIATAAVLVVSDLKRATDWYTNQLDFRAAKLDWGEEPNFSLVEREGGSIMLKLAPKSGTANRHLTPGAVICDAFIWVRDLQKIELMLNVAGTPIFAGPMKRAYGCTEIMVVDPDDYLICFGYCP
ncbi:MAG: hypothetical protein L3J13_07945 [Devosiaceae bacterium]|nr:hypothetical protein [Devosiaceae bacterium]